MVLVAEHQILINRCLARIRQLIEREGLTQVDLARRMGVSPQTVSEMLGENGNPRISTLLRIAEALGCNVADFVQNDEGVAVLKHHHMSSYVLEQRQVYQNSVDDERCRHLEDENKMLWNYFAQQHHRYSEFLRQRDDRLMKIDKGRFRSREAS